METGEWRTGNSSCSWACLIGCLCRVTVIDTHTKNCKPAAALPITANWINKPKLWTLQVDFQLWIARLLLLLLQYFRCTFRARIRIGLAGPLIMLTQVICKSKVERADVWAVSSYTKVRRHHRPKLPLGYCNLPQSARHAATRPTQCQARQLARPKCTYFCICFYVYVCVCVCAATALYMYCKCVYTYFW